MRWFAVKAWNWIPFPFSLFIPSALVALVLPNPKQTRICISCTTNTSFFPFLSIMPDTSTSIPNLVSHSFKDSLDKDLIHLYDYESTSNVPLESNSKAKQFIHVVPDLATKPAVPLQSVPLSLYLPLHTSDDLQRSAVSDDGRRRNDARESEASTRLVLSNFALRRLNPHAHPQHSRFDQTHKARSFRRSRLWSRGESHGSRVE